MSIDKDCPKCKAAPGEPCRMPSGRRAKAPHEERGEAAEGEARSPVAAKKGKGTRAPEPEGPVAPKTKRELMELIVAGYRLDRKAHARAGGGTFLVKGDDRLRLAKPVKTTKRLIMRLETAQKHKEALEADE